MENRTQKITATQNRRVSFDVIPGHFATSNSHVSAYIDMNGIKSSFRAAKEAARLQKASKKPTRAAVSQVVLPNPEESHQEAENQEEGNQEWELLIKDDEEMSDVDSLFSEMEAMGIVDEENTIPEHIVQHEVFSWSVVTYGKWFFCSFAERVMHSNRQVFS